MGSAVRNGQRVIMVLNGIDSIKQRSTESRRLMDLIFREYRAYEFFSMAASRSSKYWLGTAPKVDLVLDEPPKWCYRVKSPSHGNICAVARPVPAPIRAGDQIGTLVLSLPDEVLKLPLRAAQDVYTLGLFNRIGAAVKYLILGLPRRKRLLNNMTLRGLFITFEGGEGCGKTTQIQKLVDHIKSMTSVPFVITREPGGVPAAELIREILVNGDAETWRPATEGLLMSAARHEHVSSYSACSGQNKLVISDRFVIQQLYIRDCWRRVSDDIAHE